MPVHVSVMSLEMALLSSWSLAGESVSSCNRFDMEKGVSCVSVLEVIVGEAESFPPFIGDGETKTELSVTTRGSSVVS